MGRSTPEGAVLAAILKWAEKVPGLRLFRNHSGRAVMKGKGGRKFSYKFGVGPSEGGGSDLLGWYERPVLGHKDDPGAVVAVFVAIEVKAPGGVTKPELKALQEKFVAEVRRSGGIAGIVHSVEEAKALLGVAPRVEIQVEVAQ